MPQSPWQPYAGGAGHDRWRARRRLLSGLLAIVAGMVASGAAFAESEAAMEAFFSLSSLSGVATATATQLASLLLIWLAAGYKGMRRDVLQLAGAMPSGQQSSLARFVLVAATSALE